MTGHSNRVCVVGVNVIYEFPVQYILLSIRQYGGTGVALIVYELLNLVTSVLPLLF